MDEAIPNSFSEKDAEKIKEIECEKILKCIKPNDYVVALDLSR